MSSGGQRPAANRMTLQTFKAKLGGAKKGHALLKKKRDALKAKFQGLLREIVDTKLLVGTGMKESALSLARAQWATSGEDISATVMERARKPSITCKLMQDNVAGVSLPKFKMMHDPTKDTTCQTLGIAHGGAVVNACRETYFTAVCQLIKLASLQTAFHTLDEEIKMTGRRVNALEYVLIPRIEDIMKYITSEMDEQDREEFFRVKKVVEKKKAKLLRDKIEADKHEMEQAAAQAKFHGTAVPASKPAPAAFDAPSALEKQKDDDLVF